MILTLLLTFNPWLFVVVTVAIPDVILYAILLALKDSPVRYARALTNGSDPIPVLLTPLSAGSLRATKLLAAPTSTSESL